MRQHSRRVRYLEPSIHWTDGPVEPVEALEARRLLSVSLEGTTLQVQGTDAGEVIQVRADAATGETVVTFNGQESRWTGVALVRVLAGAGNDDVIVDSAFARPVYLDGGDGNDFLHGGAADDTLIGGAGDDTLMGNGGADVLDTRGGVDATISDASDTILTDADDPDTAGGGGGDGGTGGDTGDGDGDDAEDDDVACVPPGKGKAKGYGKSKGKAKGRPHWAACGAWRRAVIVCDAHDGGVRAGQL